MPTPKAKTVIKAFAVLKSFHSTSEWLNASELSRRAGLPRASGYRLIETLVELGLVERDPRGRYRLGMMLVPVSQISAIDELLFAAGNREHVIRYRDMIALTPHSASDSVTPGA